MDTKALANALASLEACLAQDIADLNFHKLELEYVVNEDDRLWLKEKRIPHLERIIADHAVQIDEIRRSLGLPMPDVLNPQINKLY